MRFNSKSITIAGGVAALTLSLIACHGQSSAGSGYIPPSTSAVPGSQMGGMDRDKKKVEIDSTCSHRLHVVIAAIVDCKFREKGYGNGTFTVSNDEQGIVAVSPSSGGQKTVFTILGVLVGSGHLVWKDTKGHQYKIAVRVTL